MKTAVSVPDDVFAAGDELAERLGMSRSQMYATALREFINARRTSGVTAALDRIYAQVDGQLERAFAAAQSAVLSREEW